MTKLEAAMWYHLKAYGIEHVREYRFYRDRQWRFDFAIPDLLIAIECEGGIFTGGAHTRGKHYESDMEKYNAAALLGWRVLRFSGDMIESGYAINAVRHAISEVQVLHECLRRFSLSASVLSSSLLDIPTFEKSPRRAIEKVATKKRRTTTSRNHEGAT